MAGRKSYSTEVAAYLDREIAEAQAGRAASSVSDHVGFTVAATLWHALRRRFSLALTVVALLPLAALALGALLRVLGRPDLATAPAIAALLGLALYLPWRAWHVFRRVRGLAPVRLGRGRKQSWVDIPPVSEVAQPLVVGLIAVPALLALILTTPTPAVLMGVLVALPVVLAAVWSALSAVVGAIGAVGGVAGATYGGPSSLANLDERLTRLTQMREWLRDDTLRAMVDDVIGRQVRSSERRQVVYSAAVGVVSLLAGWLLSAISPIGVTKLFHL